MKFFFSKKIIAMVVLLLCINTTFVSMTHASVQSGNLMGETENQQNNTNGTDINHPAEVKEVSKEEVSKEEVSKEEVSKEETSKEIKNTRATNISTWEQLMAAYADATVTSVSLSNDIKRTTGALVNGRATDFSIEGNGKNLDLGDQVFQVQQSATANFSISNIKTLTTTAGRGTGIVSSGEANTALSGWTINITNVNSALNNETRIVSVSGGQLNLAGNITWYTATEMAVIDGVKIADNAKVLSFKQENKDDRSFFWFAQAGMNEDTAGTHNFVIGKNAVGSFKMTGTGVSFPVVFAYYNELRLEEGATYNATMPGSAFQTNYYKSSFVADGKNKINLTSLATNQATVSFNSGVNLNEESRFYVGPESEFYIIGNTERTLFSADNINDAARTSIIIDSPKNYDLRNSSSGETINSSVASNSFKEFTIKNSDVNIWALNNDANGPATYAGSEVDYVTQLAGGSVTSSDGGLVSQFKTEGLRRISGLNQNPEFNFSDVTNAEYSIGGKVILGYVPDENGMDDEGNINYVPVYPGKGQASVNLVDSFGVLQPNLKTDDNGDIKYTGITLNKEDELVKAIATNGSHVQEGSSEYKVVDITPPEPTELLTTDVSVNTTTLEGKGEVDATVYLELNGSKLESVTTEVDKDGKWSMTIPAGSFVKDMKGQLLLEDKAGKANITAPPATNTTNGNMNPREDLKYKDVTFKAGTKFVVSNENVAPEVNIIEPVKDGETYKYDPIKDSGALSLVGQYRDIDSENVTAFLEVDNNGKVIIENPKPGQSDFYDVKEDYTAEAIQKILADNKEHIFTLSAVDKEGLETKKSIKIIWEKAPNNPPEIIIGEPVKDGETYEYFPENHADYGGIVEILGNVKDLDSKTVEVFLQIDDNEFESVEVLKTGNDVYKQFTKEFEEGDIQKILSDNKPHKFTMYAEDSDGNTSEKTFIMMVWPYKGELTMKSVPDVSFGNQEINTIDKSFYVESKSDDLIIEDTRKEVSSWKVNAQIDQELINQDTNKVIPSVIHYDDQVISADKLTIFEKNDPTKGTFNLSEKWIDDQKGLNLFLPVGKISSGDYNASITWSLEETPTNKD